jgi:hypothetical protein
VTDDGIETLRLMLDASKALGGEQVALHHEQVAQLLTAAEENAGLRELLRRAVTYAHEDRMQTPGSTRLARVLGEARAVLETGKP